MPQNNWNDRSAHGPTRPYNLARPWYAYGLALLMAHSPDPHEKTALDVGCGVGEVLELLEMRRFTAVGIDGNAEQIKQVKANGLTAELADLEGTLPFADESFQVVVCLEVLEHIARAEHLLQEMHRVLKPDGLLLLTTPNFAYMGWRVRYLIGLGPVREGIHIRHFTSRSLGKRLQQAGFAILDRNSYGPVPLLNTIMARVFKRPLLLWPVGHPLENLLAFDLVYLAKKV